MGALITEQEGTIVAAILEANKRSMWNKATKKIELKQGQVAKYENNEGQTVYAEEETLVVRVPFNTTHDEAVELIHRQEFDDFKTRYPGRFENAVVMHRGEWAAQPYINTEKQYWVLSKTVSYTTA